jgi:hypothetical protein
MEGSGRLSKKQIVPIYTEYANKIVKAARMYYIHLSACTERTMLFVQPHKAAKGNKRIIYNG